GEVLDQERGARDGGPGSAHPRRHQDESEEDEEESAPYFPLRHLMRRQPWNMFTLATASGMSPTSFRSGPRERFDFHPSRVQTGATRSSSRAVTPRSLRKWLRMT